MLYKTPGFYAREIARPQPDPPLIETALPAFVGYTEKAVDEQGASLAFRPKRIRDLTEFTFFFGGEYRPDAYQVFVDPVQNNKVLRVEMGRRYYLFDALRQFYDNGGRDCLIVSVGSYQDPVTIGAAEGADADGLLYGLAQAARVDAPGLLLYPDAMAVLDGDATPRVAELALLHQQALAQCEDLQDRFAILDVPMQANDPLRDSISEFRDSIGTNDNLRYGAAYYPWLYSDYEPEIAFRELHFWVPATSNPDDGFKEHTDLALFSSSADVAVARKHHELVRETQKRELLLMGVTRLVVEQGEIEAQVIFQLHFIELAKQFLDGGAEKEIGNLLGFVRNLALAFPRLESQLTGSLLALLRRIKVEPEKEMRRWMGELIQLEKQPAMMALQGAEWSEDDVNAAYAELSGTEWLPVDSVDDLAASTSIMQEHQLLSALRITVEPLLEAMQLVKNEALAQVKQAEAVLFSEHPFFAAVHEAVVLERKKTPPSGAIAGVYANTDATVGVWKAPANVALEATHGPVLPLDEHDQESLNVHPTGKSINVIRPFRGLGTRVWGARTLRGNDNEWRYVSVRRYFNFVEEYIKKVTESFLFESNDAITWTNIRLQLTHFLTEQWRLGALVGSITDEAFYVSLGVPETMTSQDVLEGRLIIEVGLATVRPAEFIVIEYLCRIEDAG